MRSSLQDPVLPPLASFDPPLAPDHGAAGAQDPWRWQLFFLLRLACAGEFIGHGAFGVLTKTAWVPYFGVVGIGAQTASHCMPWVGTVDITLGVLALLRPMRGPLLYMTLWGLWTALLRPLSGESAWEAVERAPNYLIPWSLLLLVGLPHSWRALWSPAVPPSGAVPPCRGGLAWSPRLATAGAFVGHGAASALAVHQIGWVHVLRTLGCSAATAASPEALRLVGGCEVLLGLVVLFHRSMPFLVALACGKVLVEVLWFGHGPQGGWEVLERSANYAAPLAVWWIPRPAAGEGARREGGTSVDDPPRGGPPRPRG